MLIFSQHFKEIKIRNLEWRRLIISFCKKEAKNSYQDHQPKEGFWYHIKAVAKGWMYWHVPLMLLLEDQAGGP